MTPKRVQPKRLLSKVKRKRGRPRKLEGRNGSYDEKGFFCTVREQFSPKELEIFKTSRERLRALSKEYRTLGDLYPKSPAIVKRVVDKVKASEISVKYVWQCLGMNRNQYNEFLRYIKLDSIGKNSILAAKGYGIAFDFQNWYELLEGKIVRKAGTTEERGLTFEQFEDLIKIAIHDREALLNKFKKSRQVPKPISKRP